MLSRFLDVWVWHQTLPQMRCYPTYLQAAENGKEIVKCHDIAVDCHEPQQPRGADEQQQQERCPQHGAAKQTHRTFAVAWDARGQPNFSPWAVLCAQQLGNWKSPLGKLGQCSPAPSFQLSHSNTPQLSMSKSDFFPSSFPRFTSNKSVCFTSPCCSALMTLRKTSEQ